MKTKKVTIGLKLLKWWLAKAVIDPKNPAWAALLENQTAEYLLVKATIDLKTARENATTDKIAAQHMVLLVVRLLAIYLVLYGVPEEV